jgi:pyruvate,orthophosphate dikinase
MEQVAKDLGVDLAEVEARAHKLHEFNPMLGHRGVRLGISFPEIYEMQARAIFEAVAEVQKKAGKTVIPEIMIPLIATKKELDLMKVVVDQVASEVSQMSGQKLEYMVGTMIELPRACLRAGEIAETAEFFSFGTNDLTQTTFGLSRDDSASFLEKYQERGILEHDPFASLDVEGVGELIDIATERGRKVRPTLKLGICGEHGGDPASVFFCHKAGLDYVSCSPYRVPIARLAAAQAALGGPLKTE